MILLKYRSLGWTPEIIVFLFLGCGCVFLMLVYLKISMRPPVVLVPDAIGSSEIAPAVADEAYARNFADAFLTRWMVWNQLSFSYQRRSAVAMMWPGVQGRYGTQTANTGALVDSMSKAQSLTITRMEAKVAAPGIWLISVVGTAQDYYGGVGGKPESYHAILMLRQIVPSENNPMCLEVYGFKQSLGDDDSNLNKGILPGETP